MFSAVMLSYESNPIKELLRRKRPWRFVDFGSAYGDVIILEHDGCLDFFTATIDGENAEFELTPNTLLPS